MGGSGPGRDSDPGSFLTTTEIANIATFIAWVGGWSCSAKTSTWSNWNNQILGICGGSHAGGSGGTANTVLAHELTDGVAQIDIALGGAARTAESPCLDQNVETLWPACGEVLTILEVNSQESLFWLNLDNAVFLTNVADSMGIADPMPFSDRIRVRRHPGVVSHPTPEASQVHQPRASLRGRPFFWCARHGVEAI